MNGRVAFASTIAAAEILVDTNYRALGFSYSRPVSLYPPYDDQYELHNNASC
jgi:hypothetical protein